MVGFFNSHQVKETKFFWNFRITSPNDDPFRITEFYHEEREYRSFNFERERIDKVKEQI
jgi:hypothetical protein